MKKKTERLAKRFHWNTSMPFGSKYVVIENIIKGTINDVEKTGRIIKLSNLIKSYYKMRETNRDFHKNMSCNTEELTYILSNSCMAFRENERIRFPYPSAGALYTIDIYLICNQVKGITKGIYFYEPIGHDLVEIKRILDFKEISSCFLNQSFTKEDMFSFACIFVINSRRIESKYGDRGYRYALIETGHIAQNIYLTAKDMNMKAVAVGGFIDYKMNEILNIGLDYYTIYAVFLGK